MSASTAKDRGTQHLLELDGPDAGRWRSQPRAIRRFVGLLLLALLLSALALGRLGDALELRGDGQLAERLWLARSLPGYDIVFLGTSHVVRAVMPDVVDAALAEAGCQGRSLNLAVGGGRLAELALVIEETVAPGTIVVTEGSGVVENWARVDRRLNDQRQQVGLAFLPEALAVAEAQDNPPASLIHFAYLALRRDLGHHLLYQALFGRALDPARPRLQTVLQHRGYLPYDSDSREARVRARFLESLPDITTPEAWQAALDRLARRDPALALPAEALIGRIRGVGGRPVLLLLPARTGITDVAARNLLAADPAIPAIDLALDRSPLPWMDPDYFHDQNHVLESGARLLSQEIGRQLCALMRAGL